MIVVRCARGVEADTRTVFFLVAFRPDGTIEQHELTRSEARWVHQNSLDQLEDRRYRLLADKNDRGTALGMARSRHAAIDLEQSGFTEASGQYACPWCAGRQLTHRAGRRGYVCGSWVDRIMGASEQSENCKVRDMEIRRSKIHEEAS